MVSRGVIGAKAGRCAAGNVRVRIGTGHARKPGFSQRAPLIVPQRNRPCEQAGARLGLCPSVDIRGNPRGKRRRGSCAPSDSWLVAGAAFRRAQTGPADSFSIRWTGRRYNPFSSSEIVVSRAEAILLRVRSPGSRVPRSRSEMWTSWTPDCSARSICRQFRARRSFLMRSPVAAQMSFAMRSSSG